jgi:hypothetical protein
MFSGLTERQIRIQELNIVCWVVYPDFVGRANNVFESRIGDAWVVKRPGENSMIA